MKALFKDEALQKLIDEQGYVIVPLLNPEQVGALRGLYGESIDATQVRDLYESSRHNSPVTNEMINAAIFEALDDAGKDIFGPCRLYGGTFMVKSHIGSTVLPLHQDWSVVEEGNYNTYFVWCPLQDTGPSNGGLFVLPGSHRYFDGLRSGSYASDRYILPYALQSVIKDITLKAGEAIFYSDRLFHGSYANNSTEDRIVVTGRITEEDASLVYFHKKSDQEVDVYSADPAFYLTYIDALAKGQPPEQTRKRYTRAYRHLPVTTELLQDKIREHFPEPAGRNITCAVFKDSTLQEAFERDGYVVIDFIDREAVEDLLTFYRQLEHAPMPEYGFQVSLDNGRCDFVQMLSQEIVKRIGHSVAVHFKDHQVFTASFVVKETNPRGVVPPHQDWTFVDEEQYWSATIWCPLVDVDMNNGALGVIKGSHRMYDHVRPSPSPQYEPPFKDQLFSIFPYLNIIDLKAGQALVFNNRTIHASPPNTSGETRIAFGVGITQRDAGIKHFYMLPGHDKKRMARYDVTPEFFFSYNNARLSAMHSNGEIPSALNCTGLFAYTHKHYETDALIEAIETHGNVYNETLTKKMAILFNYASATAEEGTAGTGSGKVPLWKVYTPVNIYREIQHRISVSRQTGKPLWKTYGLGNVLREIKYRLAKRHS